MKKNKFGYLMLALIFISSGCGKKADTAVDQAIPVKVMEVKLETIQETLDYAGDIKGQEEALVYPRVSGKIVEKVKKEGDAVAKGEPIAYVDRDEVGFTFEKSPVESPMAGVVGRMDLDLGTQVTPQTAAALVVDMDKVKISVDIPEQYLPKISLGQAARITVDAYPQEIFSGQISQISPVLDTQTRAAPVQITIDNQDHRLKSGMFARTSLVLQERKSVPVVIKDAVLGQDPEIYVYLVSGDSAVLRKVKLGLEQNALCEVVEGLSPGDLVVTVGQQRLHDGAKVILEK